MAETGPENNGLVARRIEDWRRRLIDLSNRNRLISYRATRATTLEIAAPSLRELLADPDRDHPWDFYLPPEPKDDTEEGESDTAVTLDELIVRSQDRRRARRPNEIEVTEPSPKRIARILDNLAKRSNTEFQDKALRILYIAAGFLDWHDAKSNKPLRSPLVLVPVELRRESTRDPYRLFFIDDEDIVINPSLTEKLRRDAGLDVPGEWEWEDKPIGEELDEIRQALQGTGWTVRDSASIGLFSFQKYVMYRDLLDHEDRVSRHPIVRSLSHGRLLAELRDADPDVPEPKQLDEAQVPENTLSILDADASQRQCVEAAKLGRSFVMQGPPGTGKSQTIANVIAEAIGQGKRVLFVSEKAAALDVVFKRLSASGLDEYCLMLHGEHAGRREVVQSLHSSQMSGLRARPGMRRDEVERLTNLRMLLNDSAELLHSPQSLLGDRTLREVHEQLAQLHAAPLVPGAPDVSSFRSGGVLDEFQSLSEVFQRLSERWYVSPDDYLWRGYDSARFTADDHARVLAILHELSGALQQVRLESIAVARELGWPEPKSLLEAERLVEIGRHLESAPSLEPHWVHLAPEHLSAANSGAEAAYKRLAEQIRAFGEAFPARQADEFPTDMALRLQGAREEVQREVGWTAAWQDELGGLTEALRTLDEMPKLVGAARERGAAIARDLGQSTAELTQRRLDELTELADLAFEAEQRPEGDWLIRAGLGRAQQIIGEVEEELTTYQRQRAELLKNYTPEVLDLDAEGIGERFATKYTSMFSRLSGGYRQDAKAIKALRTDHKLPDTLLDDLKLIASTRQIGKGIDGKSQRMAQALGSYANGRETDLEAVRSALAVAQRVTDLSRPDADVRVLGDKIAVGSSPDTSLAQAAEQLRTAKQSLLDRLPALQSFIAAPLPLFEADLDGLEKSIVKAAPSIRLLASLIEDLDRGAQWPAQRFEETQWRAVLITELHAAYAELSSEGLRWGELLGSAFNEGNTDWRAVDQAAAWLRDLNSLTTGVIPNEVRQQLISPQRSWPAFTVLADRCDSFRRASDELTSLFEPGRAEELERLSHEGGFDDLAALIERLGDTVAQLRDWTEWRAWRKRARQEGWGDYVDGLIKTHADDSEVLPAFQRAYWLGRLETFYDDDPEFAEDLRGGAFQRWVAEFCELDRKLVRTGADRLIAKREKGRGPQVTVQGSEDDLLRREANKKRRHLPVRLLLSRIPKLLSGLKPCLMMSPLTVSHFLSPDHTFDLVVFDEASQVPPQDAINCIYRGAQLVVAGDSKQLPPTPFFQIAELDDIAPEEEEASTQEDMESILDSCQVLLPSHPLRWHYRSRSEPLIAFSNQHIYDGSLVTFPSAEERSKRKGVGFFHVPDGIYDRGRTATNRREAEVAARRAVHYLTDGTGRSVGVIAFNSAQANAIAEELDLLKVHHPELEEHFGGGRLDAIFVKHLEAVQGDERDVIVFSVGYGYDADGKFTMNFGPLNKDGGQRRLNVAITRARERVELVASVRSHDFQLTAGASAGAHMLRDYVAYAEASGRVSESDEVTNEELEWPSPFEEDVAVAIADLGYEVVPNVGVGTFRIDLGVRAAARRERFLLGIECDGESYADTPTARDRERLRHEVLDSLGWGPIHRMWSLDWIRNRNGEIARLRESLEAAEKRDTTGEFQTGDDANGATPSDDEDAPRERVERMVHELGNSAAAANLPWTETYKRAKLNRPRRAYPFEHTANHRDQIDMLVDLVAIEAPLSVDYAIRRLAERWGEQARRANVRAGQQVIRQAARTGFVELRGKFLWRPDQTLTAVRVPDPKRLETRRDIDDIPPEEVDLAIVHLQEASAGLEDEQLITSVARVLGFDRTGGRIRAVVLERLVAVRRKADKRA